MAKKLAEHEIKFLLTAKDLTKSTFGGIKTALPSIGKAAKAAGIAIAAMAATVSAAAIKMTSDFADFETKTVDLGRVTARNVQTIADEIVKLPPELGRVTELTEGMYNTISAGVDDPVKSMEFLTSTAKASKAAHADMGATVKAVSDIMDGFSGKVTSAADASDLLFQIEAKGKTTFEELVPVIGQTASAANLLNLSVDEMGGLFATLTKTSGGTEKAATAMKAVLVAMKKPSTDMADAIERVGFKTAELAIKQRGLIPVLKLLKRDVQAGNTTWEKLFANQRALIGLGPAIQNNFQILGDNIEAMGERAGKTEKFFEDYTKTVKGSFDTLGNEINKISVRIGATLAPTAVSAMNVIKDAFVENEDAIVEWAAAFVKGFTDTILPMDNFSKAVDIAFSDLSADKIERWGERLGKTLNGIIKLGSATLKVLDLFARFSEGLGETVAAIEELDNKQEEIIERGTERLKQQLDKQEITWAEYFTKIDELRRGSLSAASSAIAEEERIAKETAESTMKAYAEGITNQIDTVETVAKQVAKRTHGGFRAALPEAKKIGEGTAIEFVGGIDSKKSEVETAAKELGESFVDGMRFIKEEVKNAAGETVTEYRQIIEPGMESTFDFVKTTSINAAGETVTEYKQVLLGGAADVKTSVETMTKPLGEVIDAKIIEVGVKAVDTINEFAQKLGAGGPIIDTAALLALEPLKVAAENVVKEWKTAGGTITMEIGEAMKNGQANIQTGVDAAMQPLEKLPEKAGEIGKRTGEEILTSFAEGLRASGRFSELEIELHTTRLEEKILKATPIFYDAGFAALEQFAQGLRDSKQFTEAEILDAMIRLDSYLPHSPAEKGPLANLDQVGPAIINTIADGINATAFNLESSISNAMNIVTTAIDTMIERLEAVPEIKVDINTDQVLTDIQDIKTEIDEIPESIDIIMTLDITDVLSKVAVARDTIDSTIPTDITKNLILDISSVINGISIAINQIALIPDDINKELHMIVQDALDNIRIVTEMIEAIPLVTTKHLNIDIGNSLNNIELVKSRLDDIPDEIHKTLILDVKTKASPVLPFSEGMDRIEKRIDDLPIDRELLLRMTDVGRGGTIDPRLTDVGRGGRVHPRFTDVGRRPPTTINQDIGITVNVQAGDIGTGNIDVIATNLGDKIARQLDTKRQTLLAQSIRRLAI
jgi:TP901 family phage tail tape measure protein